MRLALGLAGHKVDPRGRTLRMRDFLAPTLAYPAACDLMAGLEPDTDDLKNKYVGLCALAGPGHFTRWEDRYCGRPDRVHGDEVLAEYKAMVPGYDPADPSSDTGLYWLDVAKRWRKQGLFGLPPILAFGSVDYFDPDEVARAKFCLGGVFFCFNLPNKVKDGSIFEAPIWDVAEDDGGVAGGHLVWDGNSWGAQKLITPAFVARYCFDAGAVVSAESIKPGGRAYSGLDLAGLVTALLEVTA
jgi:hypothetical protein